MVIVAAQGKINISITGIDQIAGNHYDIGISLGQHRNQLTITLSKLSIMKIRNLSDSEAIKAFRKLVAHNAVFRYLQRGIAPEYPNGQRN